MGIRSRIAILLILFTGTVLVSKAGPRGLPAQQGILNFGKVNDLLYRGAQPDTQAIENLKRLGIKAVISLCQPGRAWKIESAAASANGLICTNFPLSGTSRPKEEQVRMVLATMESLPGPVFIHCAHGCDRTGTIVACYRMQHDKWSTEDAMAEAERYGLSRLERGMRLYITEFGRTPKPVVEASITP